MIDTFNKNTAVAVGGCSVVESMGCKISFRKLFSLFSLVMKDLASFPARITDKNMISKEDDFRKMIIFCQSLCKDNNTLS